MPFKRFSRRQFGRIAGWSALGMSMLSAGSGLAQSDADSGNAKSNGLFRFSERVSVGHGDLGLSGRGSRERGRPRPVDLGPLRPHARHHLRSQQRRYRDRPLSSLQGRHPVDEGAGHQGLSIFDRLAARLPGRHRRAKSKGPRFLQPPRRRVAGERHRAVCDAVSLGPAAGAAGSFRRLDLARHVKGICGLRGLCRGAPERPREAFLHHQRMLQARSSRP